MSIDFKIQKDAKKTIEITSDDIDDIQLEDLNEINFDDLDNESLHFTKGKIDNIDNIFGSKPNFPNRISPAKKPTINIKKDDNLPPVIKKPVPQRPLVEPDSQDLGLDMIVNQNKKLKQTDEESIQSLSSRASSKASKSSRGSKRSMNLDDLDKVKNIMDEQSESIRSDKSQKQQDEVSLSSELSDKIKEKLKKKTFVSESERKQELLFLFDKLEKKGIKIPQKFNMKSSIDEMEKTYERLKNERDLQNSIKFQRRVLMGIVSTMEFLNHSMNPFDIDLDGWSESVMENYSEYDDIFEELYEKYKNKGHISPEVKLIMTLAGSAFYFHLSKMIIKPAQQKMQEMFGQMENGGGGGMPDMGGMGGLMSGLMNNFMGGGSSKSKPSAAPPKNGGGMTGPKGFDDIISKNDEDSDIPSITTVSSKGRKRTLNM